MGIVISQSIKNTVYTYLGFLLGGVNTLFFYTHFMSEADYGTVSLLLSVATVLSPLLIFGSHQMIIRYYPQISKEELPSLFGFAIAIPVFVLSISGLGLYVFYEQLTNWISSDTKLPTNFLWNVYLIAIGMAFFEVFYAISRVSLKTVVGNFTKEVFHRILTTVLLLLLYVNWIEVDQFFFLLVFIYLLRTVTMLGYIIYNKQVHFSLSMPKLNKSMLSYTTIMFLGGVAALVILEVDKIMINLYINVEKVAYYTLAVFISTVVAVPFRSINQIMQPLTSKIIAENNRYRLIELYKTSSINLTLVSVYIFLLLAINMESLYSFIPEAYAEAIPVVYILGISKCFDASLGINNAIITNSKNYGYILSFGILLAVTTVLFNSWLLPNFGIVGAAYASLLAVTLYNVLKLILVYKKYKMLPYTIKFFIVIIVGVVVYYVVNSLQFTNSAWWNILLNSVVASVLYLLVIYRLKISDHINYLIAKTLRFK